MNQTENTNTLLKSSLMDRRKFLKIGILTSLASLTPFHGYAAIDRMMCKPERELSFYNCHTSEKLDTVYYEKGNYLTSSLDEINYILRDFRTGDVKNMDTDLLDLLYVIREQLGACSPFHIISGYRSPATNNKLRSGSGGVARRSLHMVGKAVDIRMPGFSLSELRKVAISLRRGGVGYYPSSNFVHVDVGRVRYW
jgi:uncharacterized protein YcbK (DUF882 family)